MGFPSNDFYLPLDLCSIAILIFIDTSAEKTYSQKYGNRKEGSFLLSYHICQNMTSYSVIKTCAEDLSTRLCLRFIEQQEEETTQLAQSSFPSPWMHSLSLLSPRIPGVSHPRARCHSRLTNGHGVSFPVVEGGEGNWERRGVRGEAARL